MTHTAEGRPGGSADAVMISLVAPVSGARIERWVGEQIDRLRRDAGPVGLRLGRLSPAIGGQGADWLVEADLRHRDVPLEADTALTAILVDLQLLGLQPQLIVPSCEGWDGIHGADHATSRPAAGDQEQDPAR